jgi:hypothetical protein
VHLPRSGSGRDYLSDCEELHNPYSSRALAWRPPSPSGSIRAHAAAFVTAHGSLDLFAQPPSTTVPPQPAARRIRIRSTTPTSATATLPRRALGAAPPSHPPPSTHPPTVCASWTELASPTCASPVRLGCSFTPQTPLTAAVIAADGLYKRDVFRRCSRPPVCHPGAHSAQASRTPSPWPRSMASRRAPQASSRRR